MTRASYTPRVRDPWPWQASELEEAMDRVQAHAADVQFHLDQLAERLERTLPEQVTVERGRRIGRARPVRRLRVQVQDHLFGCARTESGLHTTHARRIRGIDGPEHPLAPQRWASLLRDALHEQAQSLEAARSMLTDLL
jgi:hypothetical protein